MKTMIEVAINYLDGLENKTAGFYEIWNQVSSEMRVQWKERNPKTLLKDVEEAKIGELYTLLTIDANFIRTQTEEFGLTKYFTANEISQMKVLVGEELD